MVERDFLLSNGLRFSPYGSAELFYNGSKRSRNEEWYTAGIEWPYKRRLMLDTYYRATVAIAALLQTGTLEE